MTRRIIGRERNDGRRENKIVPQNSTITIRQGETYDASKFNTEPYILSYTEVQNQKASYVLALPNHTRFIDG